MTEREDIDMLAAEYALGTLDADERTAVAARRLREKDLDDAIAAWELRLSPMLDDVAEAQPSPALFDDIRRRIDTDSAPRIGENVIQLRRAVVRWRWISGAATAVAAGLAAFIIATGQLAPTVDQRFVAVFQQDDRQPQFVLTIDLSTREVVIRPVEAQAPAGKTFQLWIASDELGGKPRSLGLIGPATQPVRKKLDQYDAGLLRAATFGISLEPDGGSPTGTPTGPAIHGRLIPTID